jgi:dipeptidase D
MSILNGKKMINLDAEDALTLTVSCAGGSDFKMVLPIQRKSVSGTRVVLTLKGLKGGHSGVEIHAGRVNADILAGRVLNDAKKVAEYGLLSVSGGDKGNAIPLCAKIEMVVQNSQPFVEQMREYLTQIATEIKEREENFTFSFEILEDGNFSAMNTASRDKLIYALLCAPNGVMEMSASIDGLVETSLNLGVLKTEEEQVFFHFALRSNKKTALQFSEEKLVVFAQEMGCDYETSGHYPPWEYRENSELQRIYQEVCKAHYGKEAKVVAIHAGLECAVFASKIKDLDCIAIGAEMFDIHTTQERLSISSTEDTYQLLLEILKNAGKKS